MSELQFLESYKSIGALISFFSPFLFFLLAEAYRSSRGPLSLIKAKVSIMTTLALGVMFNAPVILALIWFEKFKITFNMYPICGYLFFVIIMVSPIILIYFCAAFRRKMGIEPKLVYLIPKGGIYKDKSIIVPVFRNYVLPEVFWIIEKEGNSEKIVRNLTSEDLGHFEVKSKMDDFETRRIFAKVYRDPLNY